MSSRKITKKWTREQIIALVGVIVAIIIGVATLLWPERCRIVSCASDGFIVRVTDEQNRPFQGASIVFYTGDGAITQYTDSNGSARISGYKDQKGSQLVIQANGYMIYEHQFAGYVQPLIKHQLELIKGSAGKIIFRLLDQDTGELIPNAELMVFVDATNQANVTDSNGIVKFDIEFPPIGMVDVKISVKGKDYQLNNQNLTLYPNSVQDILISKETNSLVVGSVSSDAQAALSRSAMKRITETGVIIGSLVSEKVDPNMGFRIDEMPYKNVNQDMGELQVNYVTPDNKPLVGIYTTVSKQEVDVNSEPMVGAGVGAFQTDEGGISKRELPQATYVITPNIGGYSWKPVMYNHEIRVGDSRSVLIVPSQLAVMVHLADGSILTTNFVTVNTQKQNANGKSIPDQPAGQGFVDETGISLFTITPGRYAITMNNVLGNDWGSTDIDVPPSTLMTIDIHLGRIQFESRDKEGDVTSGYSVAVAFVNKDANGKNIPGEPIKTYWTEQTGIANIDLAPGAYFVYSNDGRYMVELEAGKTTIVKNTDLTKPSE